MDVERRAIVALEKMCWKILKVVKGKVDVKVWKVQVIHLPQAR
jgi:hypothetical protein